MVCVHPKTAKTDSSTTGALLGAGSLRPKLSHRDRIYGCVRICGPVGNGFLLPAQHWCVQNQWCLITYRQASTVSTLGAC